MYSLALFWKKRRLLEFWRGILKRGRCARRERARKRTGAYFESIESRVLLSGGVEGVLADTDLLARQDLAQVPVAAEVAFLEEAQETALLDLSGPADPDPKMQPDLINGVGMRDLVFVDENVADYEQLIAGLQGSDDNRTTEVVVLNSDRDGIEQVSEILNERSNLSAVHFITHGADGQINLGGAWLNSTTLQENIDAISAWGNALIETGDILFYGCSIAAASDGQGLLKTIADLTGADVAASDDPTGHAASGGDWDLEYLSGDIEMRVALRPESQQNWSGVLATFTVNTTADAPDANPGDGLAVDSGGNTSLRAAIMEANALAGADTVSLAAGTYTLSRAGTHENAANTGDLDITDSLTISGAGANATYVDGGALDRVFQVHNGSTVNIQGVTVRNGAAPDYGGGLYVSGGANQVTLTGVVVAGNAATSGGAIYNYQSLLTVVDSAIEGNTVSEWGGGLYNDRGTVSFDRVAVTGNSAGEDGGGLYNFGLGSSMTLTNVTVSGNMALGTGGALYTNRVVAATNVTVAFNSAGAGSGGIHKQNPGTTSLKNCILANNTGGNANAALTSLGNNIDSDGTAALAGTGDLSGVDPLLAALGANGGPTKTHALLAGSPAIDPAGLSGAPPVDQRGAVRDGLPDIGAFEYGSVISNNPGTVTIDNATPAQGDSLTAIVSDADGVSGVIAYRWYRDGVVIAGATAASYTTSETDVGRVITVTADYTDDLGNVEGPTSAGTTAVANVNDAPVGLPTITGTVTEDQVLTADVSGISDADGLGAFSYQWLKGVVAIGGATNSTYTMGDADVGTQIAVQVSYTDGQGTAESLTSAQTAAVANVNDAPVGSVTISGTPTEDQTLTVSNTLGDADGMGVVSYQWQRDGVDIAGATNPTYTLTDADVGTTMTVVAAYTDGQGTNESVSSAGVGPVANVNDAPVGLPLITGTVTEDQTLTADTTGISDADGLGALSYQWLRNGANIVGATSNTYTLGDADVGTQISVQVSYTDGHGTNESLTSAQTAAVANVNDTPVGVPTITGTVTEDQTLTASTAGISDADGLGAFSYQWLRNGANISGATSSAYTLGDADVGAQIRVEVSYTDGQGTNESLTSAQTATVANVNDAPVGLLTITGTATEDQTLTADTSGISDADGLGAFSYQWLRDGAAIAGATTSTYTLTDADVGTQISIQVSYTDAHGTNESLTSAQTAAVANVNDAPVGLPTITGTVTEDQVLSADTSGISDADGLGALSYQWLRDGVAIAGATNSTYTLGGADVGTQISVQVSYTDGQGTAESLTSAQTAVVLNVNDAPTLTTFVNPVGPTNEDTEVGITLGALKAQGDEMDVDGSVDAFVVKSVMTGTLRIGPNGGSATPFAPGTNDVIDAVNKAFWIPPAEANGALNSFELVARDNLGAESTTPVMVRVTVTPVNDAPVGLPLITGTVTEDQVLSADTSGISDADGLGALSYQWLRNGSAIAGATNSTYTLGDADVGTQISVQVSYTDGQGTAESLTSAQTAAVANANDPGTVVIDDRRVEPPVNDVINPGTVDIDNPTDVVKPQTVPSDNQSSPLPEHTEPSPNSAGGGSVPKETQKEASPQADIPGESDTTRDQPSAKKETPSDPRVKKDLASLQLPKQSLPNAAAAGDGRSAAVQKQDLRPERPFSVMRASDYEHLRNSLDAVKEEMTSETRLGKVYLGSAIVSSIGLSVGYVVWLLRGGMLLASLLTSMPAWQFLDPLPILARKKDDDNSDDNESLESIVDKKPEQINPKKRTADAAADAEVKGP
jgi:CSLREA domain-containing protein